jgi:3'-phosphoadenosine 5'-phosphosulfate sulfotransferase (PAPS reductase)/FAD synthetase
MSRIVCWFSCGAASAVATKLALKKYGQAEIVYCDTSSEHPDNARFIEDCQRWFGQKIVILKSEKYHDTWDVFRKTRYLVGVGGARCTTELKKVLRNSFQRVDDTQVFGFDSGEKKRFDRFKHNNPEVNLEAPLLDNGISKADCFKIISDAGIEIPIMYRLGYKNNNCIGCVKGQSGYWNKIRKDFPDVFNKMAKIERELNVAINKSYAGDGKRKRIFLDELPPDAGRYNSEPSLGCGVLCDLNSDEARGDET